MTNGRWSLIRFLGQRRCFAGKRGSLCMSSGMGAAAARALPQGVCLSVAAIRCECARVAVVAVSLPAHCLSNDRSRADLPLRMRAACLRPTSTNDYPASCRLDTGTTPFASDGSSEAAAAAFSLLSVLTLICRGPPLQPKRCSLGRPLWLKAC